MLHKHLTICLSIIILSSLLGGCRAPQGQRQSSQDAAAAAQANRQASSRDAKPTAQSNRDRQSWPEADKPLAFVAGRPVTPAMLYDRLIEQAGGQVLAEVILDQLIDQRLARQGLIISPDMIQQEKELLLAELSPDPDEAARLLQSLRQSRGITTSRFDRTLRRNAALRRLVRDEIEVTPLMLQQEYDLLYGQKFEARIITTAGLGDMQLVLEQLKRGQSFTDVAIARSTDPSRSQGGLLSPISLADTTYPAVVRDALANLEEGQLSQPVALDQGYAILKLERKIAPADVKFDDVKDDLTRTVSRQTQAQQMRLLARQLMEAVDVVVLDPALKQSWDRQQTMLNQNP